LANSANPPGATELAAAEFTGLRSIEVAAALSAAMIGASR
jgi:hypothetical protein